MSDPEEFDEDIIRLVMSHPGSSPEQPKVRGLELSAFQESPGLVLGANRIHTDKAQGCVVSDSPEEGWIGRNLPGPGS